jgi:asparagine synthase (glutamine-hydrolysing)
MPGIWGVISEKENHPDIDLANEFHRVVGISYLEDREKFSNSVFGRVSVNKFHKDKIFYKIGNSLACTDGIILNLKYLLNRTKFTDLSEYLLKSYQENNFAFLNQLRGNFAGFLYFEQISKLIVFADHLASKPIYYFYDKNTGTFIFASELKAVIKGMKLQGFSPHLDIKGAYCLLVLGYMLENLTLVEEIKKIPPGTLLVYGNGRLSSETYYRLSSKPYINECEDKIIDELDVRFKEAVKLEYEKDAEYNYKHIATLSGGLDSRTNVAYAKKLGYKELFCFTFSESNYLDEIIAKKICSDNYFEFVFYALDNGKYLLNYIDDIILSNSGLALFSGGAHAYSCLKRLSLTEFGLIHTGEIGDLVLGSYLSRKHHNPLNDRMLHKIAYSTILIDKLNNQFDLGDFNYENDELFAFYERCINGTFNGYRMLEQFTEFSSPFLHIDFLDYAMKIPPRLRYKEAIYLKWINKCIPEFSVYKWEKYNLSPRYPISLLIFYKKLMMGANKVLRRKPSSMNPMNHWWNTNSALRDKVNILFNEYIENIEEYTDLAQDCKYLFENGSLIEKTQVITLLRAVSILEVE